VDNPATGEIIDSFASANIEQAEAALQAAKAAFPVWSHFSLMERISWMNKLRDSCLAEKDAIIDLLSKEGGKPKSQTEAVSDFNLFIGELTYYGEEAKHIYGTELPEFGGHRDTFHVVVRRPIGVTVAHMAWNMPLRNLGLKLAPAMASGCTCVIKPSTATPLATLKVGELAEKIGLPAGVCNIITGSADIVGRYLNESDIPGMVSVVGSTDTGKEVLRQASKNNIKHYSMELGGNCPAIIMPDADPEQVAKWMRGRKILTAGQGCSNINRIYVHEKIHDAFVEKLAAFMKEVRVGWGSDMPDAMGPLMTVKARDRVLALIQDTVALGAKLVYGGAIPELPDHLKKGAFMLPTILDGVTDDMPITQQELFAPVCPILTFTDLDDVITRSNNTEYGLCTYLFTHDSRVIGKCMEEIQAGMLQVNMPGGGLNMPHVGIKNSGIGSDVGHWSLEDYYNIRRISIQP
jgi:succinate-semialdehyde dehydrogenase/glutarate-semialdehyde dehydrogenase